jgi:GDP-6-deoxy-D-talose 4-dehydrogenase
LNILLTGASGFTGIHFTRYAESLGHAVIPLKGNLCDPSSLRNEFEQDKPSHVLHLGGISFVGHGSAGAFYEVNVLGTMNLLDALRRTGLRPKKVVLASSATVYGNTPFSPITEVNVPVPANHYGMSKLAMEYMVQSQDYPFEVLFARAFNYTGPGQDVSFVIPKLIQHFKAKAGYVELGNIDVEREFNDVRMVCEAYLRLLESKTASGIYNLCTGRVQTLRAMIATLEKLSGHALEVRVNPQFVRANEIQRLCGDPTKLLSVTGPLSVPDLEDTLSWMLAELSSEARA